MKVGIITFHNAHNFGASLQTWALQKVLQKTGFDASIIHYHPDIIDDLYNPYKVSNPNFIKSSLQKLRLKVRPVGRERILRYKRYTDFITENFRLIGDFKNYEELSNANLDLDAYITGSDQVWNCDHTNGFDPAYFLEFAPETAIKLSYAASIGKNHIAPEFIEKYKKSLESFDAISIREESTKELVSTLTTLPVNVVLDPTLLLDKDAYDEIKSFPDPGEKYILVYMMEHNKELIQFADKLSVALGRPIIQRRPFKHFKNELKSCFTCTPGEFLGLIEHADYVITNSFHGTVFSLIYQKPFVSMLHSDTGARTADLLKSLGEEQHLLYSVDEFRDMKQFEIKDPERLEKNIQDLRTTSLKYLQDALSTTK